MILLDRQASVHLSSSSSGCTRYWQPPGWYRPAAAFAPEAKENLMPFDLSLISLTPDLRTLPGAQARIALSTRIVVVLTKLARDPRPELANRLGSEEAAERFLRSEEHTSELQSLMRLSYAVFCLKKKNIKNT